MAASEKADVSAYVKGTASLAEANNCLAVKLHKLLANEQKNVFFSPFSVSTALAMLFHGAREETAQEMRNALGYEIAKLSDDQVTTSYGLLLETLSSESKSYTLAFANSLLGQKDFLIKEQYKSDLKNVYQALLKEVDFFNESQKVVSEINEYVKENTNQMIPQLLDSLDPATVIVILNAIYFKGSWLHQFEEQRTHPQTFYNKGLDDNAEEVPMMHLTEDFPFVQKKSFKALQLPYKGEDVAMLLLLPHSKTGLVELESNLSDNFVGELRKEMFVREVNVSLPKFRMEYSKSLKETFQNVGMTRVFQVGADLSGLSDSKELAVSDIVHKAVLEVNEEGSEAAAATAVTVMLCCLKISEEFLADHPFLFLIYDKRNDLILFIGRVEEL